MKKKYPNYKKGTKKYAKGGPTDTLFVSNPNDPRLQDSPTILPTVTVHSDSDIQAYQDSLKLFNNANPAKRGWTGKYRHTTGDQEYDGTSDYKYWLAEDVIRREYNGNADEFYKDLNKNYPEPIKPIYFERGESGNWNGWGTYKKPTPPTIKPPSNQVATTIQESPYAIRGQVPNPPRLNIKPEVKRQYKEENGKYYMRFFDKQTDKEEWRPITKESYRLGQNETDKDINMRTSYKNGGKVKKYEYGGKDGKSMSGEEGGDMMGMATGMIPGMGFLDLATNLKGNIDTLKSDTINKAGKAQAGLNVASDALDAAASIPSPATPFLKIGAKVVDAGASIAGMFAKEDAPDMPKKFTSQNYAQGNFKQGGATAKGISLAGFGGGMTRLHSSPEVDIYQTAGKRHSKGGITTPDGSAEYETGETYLKFKDGGYFLPRQAAKSFNSKIKNMQQGPMTAGKEFTMKYMMNQAIKENEALLPPEKQMNFALGGSTQPQQVTLSPNSFQKLAANKPTMTPEEFRAYLQKTGNTHVKTYSAGTPNKGFQIKAKGGYYK